MNAAYKWYRYNSNIVQFYSGESASKKSKSFSADSVKETIERSYDYTNNFIESTANDKLFEY